MVEEVVGVVGEVVGGVEEEEEEGDGEGEGEAAEDTVALPAVVFRCKHEPR